MFNDKQQQRVGQLEIQSAIVEDVYRVSATIKAKTVAMCHASQETARTNEIEGTGTESVAVTVAAFAL